MWGFIVALISGALMSIQGVFNTEVTKQTSLWVSTGWVQFSAFLVCVLAWMFTGRDSIGSLWQIENKYTLLGGVIGAFITITVIQSMGSLGPAKAVVKPKIPPTMPPATISRTIFKYEFIFLFSFFPLFIFSILRISKNIFHLHLANPRKLQGQRHRR